MVFSHKIQCSGVKSCIWLLIVYHKQLKILKACNMPQFDTETPSELIEIHQAHSMLPLAIASNK